MPDPGVTFIDDVLGALRVVYGSAGKDADTGIDFGFIDALAKKYGEERGGELIGMRKVDGVWVENPNAEWAISKTTRDRTNELLQEAMSEGWSPQRFAERLEESGLYDESRAEMIARTEVAIAQNAGQIDTMREAGYDRVYVYDSDYDEECAAVDGKVASLAWASANPTAHPNAVFSGTKIVTLGGVSVGYRAKWSGPARFVVTAGGNRLTISANHPVLTGRGWVSAKNVRNGDHVVYRLDREAVSLPIDADFDQRPAAIEDVFSAALRSGLPTTITATRAHFHDDGNFCEGEIDVVLTDGQLTGEWDAPAREERGELVLPVACPAPDALPAEGASGEDFRAVLLPAAGGVALLDVGRVAVPGADRDVTLLQPASEAAVADAAFLRELESRFPVKVALDKVVEVGDVEAFSSHAFDLSTGHRAYFASNILVHNCTRSFSSAPEDEPIELE